MFRSRPNNFSLKLHARSLYPRAPGDPVIPLIRVNPNIIQTNDGNIKRKAIQVLPNRAEFLLPLLCIPDARRRN